MKTHSLSKRFLSLFLCIVFCFSLLPTAAFADDVGDSAETPEEAGVIVLEGTEDPAEEAVATEAATEEEELPEELEPAELERIQRPGGAEINARIKDTTVALVYYADDPAYEEFASLQDAIDAAGMPDDDGYYFDTTVVLYKDVTLNDPLTISKSVTLDLDGKTLTLGAVLTQNAGEVEIKNGTLTASVIDAIQPTGNSTKLTMGEGLTYTATSGANFYVQDGAELVIDGAEITTEGVYVPVYGESGAKITMTSGSVFSKVTSAIGVNTGTIAITGGTVTTDQATGTYATVYAIGSTSSVAISGDAEINGSYEGVQLTGGATGTISGGTIDSPYALGVGYSDGDTSSATITGGTINGTIGTHGDATIAISGGSFSEKPADKYFAEGLMAKDNGDGTYSVQDATFVAQSGEGADRVRYATLQDALNAGGEVKLIANVALDDAVEVTSTSVLDLNGFNITSDQDEPITIANGGNLTINGNGSITTTDSTAINNSGTLTIKGGNIVGTGVVVYNEGTMTMSGGKITDSGDQDVAGVWNDGGTFTMSDGEINISGKDAVAVLNTYGGQFTMTDGLVVASGNQCAGVQMGYGESAVTPATSIAITGGKVTTEGDQVTAAVMAYSGGGTVTVSGDAEISSPADGSYALYVNGGANIVVEGGNVRGAFVKEENVSGKLTISGGTFDREVPENYLAEDHIVKNNGDGTYTVSMKPYVAKIGENYYFALQDAINAAAAGNTVEILAAGTYTLPNLPQNIIIEGAVDGVVFEHTGSGNIASIPNGATFKNVAFNFGDENKDYHGFQHAGAITMENCTLNGKFFSYGDMTFTNCTFNNSGDYHMWVYGKGTVTYDKCKFYGDGKFIHAYSESADNIGKIIVNDCAFNNSGNATKAALNIKETCGSTKLEYEVIFSGNNTLTGSFPANSESSKLVVGDNGLWQVDDRLTNGAETNITVTVGDTLVYPEYVATVTVGDTTKSYTSLQNALNAAATAGADATVKLLTDADLSGVTWEPVSINANKGGKCVTVNGNNKVITGLSAPLFAGTWAGNTGLAIYDLSIVDSQVKQDVDDAQGTIGVGAFIGWPQASSQIVLSNCHLKNSTVEGGHWTGGLIGVAAGYSGNDGPVFETVTITGCSVTNSTIKGKGSVGALMGHATADAWTKVIVTGTTVTGNTLDGASGKTGILFGTAGAAGQPKTVNGETKTGGVEVNAVESGNSGATYEIGRIGTTGGVVIFNAGGAYTVDPTLTSDPATGTIAPVENYQVTVDDGVYSVTPMPIIAKIGEAGYTSLQAAIDAAHEMTGDVTVNLIADTTEVALIRQKAGLNLTVDGGGHTITGQLIIDGDGRASGTERLTIQNVAFSGDMSNFYTGSDAFILIPSTKTAGTPYYTNKYNYAHNITISGCSFTSTSGNLDVVGVKATSGAGAYNVVLSNVTGTKLHSLAQLTGTTGGSFTNCYVTGSDSFVNIDGGAGDFIFTKNTFVSAATDGYGVRIKGNSTAVIRMGEGNTITANTALQLGKSDAPKGKIIVTDGMYRGTLENKMSTDGTAKFEISGGLFANPVNAEYCAEGLYPIANTDEATKDDYPYTVGEAVAAVNGLGYATFAAAAEARVSDDDVITLLANITDEYTLSAGQTLKVQKNGFSVKVKAPEGAYVIKETTDEGVTTYTVAAAVAQIGDTYYASLAEAVAVAQTDETIEVVKAGTYTLPNLPKKVTIEGAVDGVEFNHTTAGNVASTSNGATFKNVTFNFGNVNYHGFQHNGGLTFENCTINGRLTSYGTETYKNCKFVHSGDYNMWVYGGNHTVTYDGCTFTNTSTGKFLNIYNESGEQVNVTISGCKFINNGSESKAAVNVKETCGTKPLNYNVTISNCTLEGAFPAASITDKLVVGEGGLWQVDDRLTNAESGIVVVLDDVEVYPLKHTVTFVLTPEGETPVAENVVVTVKNNQSLNSAEIQVPAPTYEHYTFKGFVYTDANGESKPLDPAAPIKGDMTFVSQWQGEPCMIIYMDAVTGSVLKTFNVEYGVKTPTFEGTMPKRDGYGYRDADRWNPTVSEKVTETMAYSVKWVKLMNVTFVNGEDVTTTTVLQGDPVAKPADPTKEGYTFKGWFNGETEYDFTAPVNEDITLTAKWEINHYTVTFDTDGGSAIEAASVPYNTAVTRPADPTKENAVFGGWFLNGAEYDFSTPVKSDLTLKAFWAVAKNVETGKLYATLGEAMNEAENGQTVQLLGNVELTERLFVNAGAETVSGRYATTSENNSITLDLNGKNITSSSNIALAGGSLNIIGEGTITTTGSGLAPIEVRGTGDLSAKRTLTIGENVTLNGDYGLNVFGSNDEQKNVIDVTVDGTVNGTLFVLGNLKNTANEINIVVNGTIAATGDDVGVALNGYANVTVNEGAKISGSCGVEVRAGKLDVTGGNITSNADATTVNPNGDGSATKGAAIAVAQHTTNLPIEVSISGGSISGVAALNVANPEGNTDSNVTISVSGGDFTGKVNKADERIDTFISGGRYNEEPNASYIVRGKCAVKEGDWWVITDAVAEIGTIGYGTLEAAFAAAQDGETIKVLKDCSGNGIIAPQGKFATGLTVDFDGHTYTVDGSTVGSTGTETNGFQLLKDNKITFKNGTISSEKAKILVQNYSNLTLDSMTLSLNNENYTSAYTLSNNNGNITIKDSTINANQAGGFAFDVCRYSSYPSVNVTVTGNSTINGNIEVSASGNDAKEGFSLMLESGTFNGAIVLDPSAEAAMEATPEKAAVKKNNTNVADNAIGIPADYKWAETEDNNISKLVKKHYVAQIGETKYESLAEAAAAAVDGDTIVMIDNSTETVRVRIEKSITLDLNGKTVSNTDTVMNVYKDFVVLDSSEEGTGKIESTGSAGRAMQVLGGTTTLKSGSLYGKQIAVLTYEGNFVMDGGYASGGDGLYALSGSITVNGGSVNVTGTAVTALNESTVSITGGTVFGKNAGLNLCDTAKATINGGEISGLYGIGMFDSATCVMNDGTVKATGFAVSSNFHSDKGFTFTINGGQLLQTDKDQPAIYMPGIGTVNINGGYIEGKYGVKMYHGVLNITGGTIVGLSESAVQIINTYWGANDLRSDADRVNYAQIPQVSISGGNMIGGGGHDAVVSETGSNTHQTTGEVYTGEQVLNFISGGWFSNEIPENFCAEGIIPDRNAHADAPDSRAQYTVKTGEYVAQNVQTGLKYETLAEAIAEAGDNNTILLLEDIQETQNTISKNLTLDLNGKTLTGRLTADAGDVTVKNGTVVGRVDGYDNTNLVIDEDAKIQGQLIVWGDGEFDKDGCKTPTVTVKGEITNTGDSAISTNGTDKSGAKIIIDEKAKITSADEIAIYLPSGNLTVNGGEITGATAIYQKSGSLVINGGTITGNGAKTEYNHNGNGAYATGDAIVVESCSYPNGAPLTNIYGGTLNTSNGLQVGYYENNDDAVFADVYAKNNTLTIPEDYKWVAQSEELYKLTKKHYVAQNVETEKKYETLTEAVNTAEEGQTVKLLENLTDELSEYVIINNNKAFSIDLAGYTANGGIRLEKGHVTIDNGMITDEGYGMPLEVTGFKQSENASNSLTLGEDVTVRGTWGLILWNADGSNDGYGSTININGKVEGVVFVSGNLYQGDSVINVKGNIEGEDHGVALNGYAIVNVEEGASIIGSKTGIEVRAGELNVSGGTITGNGSEVSVKANGSGTTTDGAGIAVAQHTTKLPIKINVTGGTITGAAAFYESNPQNNAEADLEKIQVSITGGNFFGTGTEAIHAEDLKDFVSAVKTGEEITNRPWASSKINETYVADPYTASNEMEYQPPFTVSLARTVTFDANGGELTLGGETKEKHEIVLPDGETVAKPVTDPTKEGYHFLGWFNGEDEYNFQTPVTSDVTLKAKWEINVYTVTFTWTLEGVAEPVKETVTVEHGQSLNDADITVPTPTDTNYNFVGFIYTDEAGNHDLDPDAPITGNMTFIGQWDNKTYLVVYTDNANNGKILESYLVKYDENTPAFQGTMPTREGYAIRQGQEWNPAVSEKVTAPVAYDVNWVKILNVTFVNDAEQSKITVLQGDKIEAPEQPTKEGYTFLGWFPENSAVAFDFNTEVQTDLVLTATWKANEYTITFMNGETEVAKLTQDYGTTVIAPEDPTKEGYSFKGWAPALPATMPAENLTVEATWEINQYTITFDTDGGSEIAPITQDYGTAVTAPANPTKEGYTFKGWDTEIPATMPAKNLTIKATWETNEYTITFMDGETELAKLTQDYGTAVTAPADPTKEGYTFKGWDAEIPATMPAEDLTIKATWETKQYTITFMDGEAELAKITQDYGTTVMAPEDPTKEGYTFKGWDTEIPATMPAEDLTIKATWEIKQYTVTFDTDGGSAIEAVTVDHGQAVEKPEDPTKDNAVFGGWLLNGAAYDFETPVTDNLTLKASWAEAVAKNVQTGKLYTTLGEAMNEVQDGQTVQLLANVELTERLFVNAGAETVTGRYATTSENKSITLDLNGKNITSSSNIALAGGSLNIIGEGAITTTGSGLAPIEVRGTGDLSAKRTLTIGENVTLNGDYGLNVFGSNDEQKNVIDVTVDGTVNGTLFVLGNLKNTANEINIVVNGTIAATGDDVGVALNGYANVTVNEGAKISGSCGVEVRAGKLDVTGGNITSTADATTVNPNGDGSATKGAAIAVAQHTTNLPIEVSISGGNISGSTALNIANPEGNTDSNVKVSVSDGVFNGAVNNEETRVTKFISGGYFRDPVLEESCAEGYVPSPKLTEGEYEGMYTVTKDQYVAMNLNTGVKYTTLNGALAEAKSGETVVPLTNITNEAYILVMSGITLDLNGFNVTNATLFYVTGTLVDHGETRGQFSAAAYHLSKSVNSEFPIYNSEMDTYSLYNLSIDQYDPTTYPAVGYSYRMHNSADRADAVSTIKASDVNGRVAAAVTMYWTEGSDLQAKEVRKTIAFSDDMLKNYTTSPSQVYKVTFTGLDTLEGKVTAVPTFIVYDATGAIMMTLEGQPWNLK